MTRILVTGGAGFIGSNFLRLIIETTDFDVTVLDRLKFVGRVETIKDVEKKIKLIKGDIANINDVMKAMESCDYIVNFAAESHVDRSITDAESFVRSNILGTFNLLEAAKKLEVKRFLHISTDEVYGSRLEGDFKEDDALDPSSPYSATKAGSDLLANAYFKTYGVPVLITRSSNNYGPFQFPEKFIPKMITNAILNKPLPIYGDGKYIRDWVYVMDNCEAILTALMKGKLGEIYNISTDDKKMNIEIAKFILQKLNKPESLIQFVVDRPAHDRRYSISSEKIKKLGWKPKMSLEEGLVKTIGWYQQNTGWWKPLIKD